MTTNHTSIAMRDDPGPGDRPLRWFVGVPFRPQTYRNLAYLLLAFPLGIAYFVAITVAFSLGTGLLVALIGLPLLLLTTVAATLLAGFEARLASLLVGVEAPLPEVLRAENRGRVTGEDGLVDALGALVTAPTTWTSLVLVGAKFVYGIVAFTLLVTAFAVVTALLSAPVVYADPAVQYTVGWGTIETLPGAIAVAVAGVVVGLVSLHLLNALAIVGGLFTAALLAIEPSDETCTDEDISGSLEAPAESTETDDASGTAEGELEHTDSENDDCVE